MTSAPIDKIEESSLVLRHEIEKLDELGLTFAASLVKIAHLDLQMKLHNVTEEEIDVLSFAVRVIEQEQQVRDGPKSETLETSPTLGSKEAG